MKQISHISLSQLAYNVEQAIKQLVAPDYWIVAEISECSVNSKGHCYLELIEKPEQSDNILAKMRATIWAYNFRLISVYFKTATGIPIQAGLKVLVKVSVEYHAIYGISLNITDIDPIYTIGEDEKQRRDIMQRLANEGIMDMNKDVSMPLVPQRIAIISSATAAGYQDFMEQLTHNHYNLKYSTTLFPTIMQGLEVENSIITSLDAIYEQEDSFDIVVIIRGGGSKTDLRWFDNYRIAAHVAQFPIPILSGIGHDKDESIVDMVSHTSLKTPTAVAEYIISCGTDVLYQLDEFTKRIQDAWNQEFSSQKEFLQLASKQIQHILQTSIIKANSKLREQTQNLLHNVTYRVEKENTKLSKKQQSLLYASNYVIRNYDSELSLHKNNLKNSIKHIFQNQVQNLTLHYTKLNLHNPQHILQKGYSITTNSQGAIVKSTLDIQKGEKLFTKLLDGNIVSTID